LVDLGQAKNRLGGSALAQVYSQVGNETPDADPAPLSKFLKAIINIKAQGKLLAYHDRSDGGLFATLCEMAFASRCGLEINIAKLSGNTIERLFNEELGVVIQVKKSDENNIVSSLCKAVGKNVYVLGRPVKKQEVVIKDGQKVVYKNSRAQLEAWWSETSYQLQKLRDNPECADQEFTGLQDDNNPGLSFDVKAKQITKRFKPILDIRKARSSPDLSNSATNGFSSFDVSTDTSSSDKTVFARVNSPLERTILRKSSIKDRLEFRNEKSTDLVKRLKREGIKKVLIVGGPRIISELLKGKLIDFLYLTIEPRLFGQGVLLLDSFPIDIELNLVEHKELNKKGTILLKYSLKQTQ